MTQVQVPPPPPIGSDEKTIFRWWNQIYTRLTAASQVLWESIDKANSTLSDLEERSHSQLDNVLSVDETDTDTTKNKHTSNALEKASADHRDATSAHGVSGTLVGTGDTATTSTAGVVLQAAAVADLAQTITDPPTQAEVQAISDKIDNLLAALRTAGILNT